MRVKEVTFSCTRTIPLQQITRDPTDQYSNLRPMASCTVVIEDGDCDGTRKGEQALVKSAYAQAEEHVTDQLAQFYASMVEAFAPKPKQRGS